MRAPLEVVIIRNPISQIRTQLVLALLLVAAGLVGCGGAKPAKKTVRAYVGAGMRRAVDELAEAFEAETGIAVEADYGGSGIMETRAQMDPAADVFLPGDVHYVDDLHAKAGLIEEKTDIAWFVPVILVAKGNPKGIRGLGDLFRDDVKAGLGDPKACQVGRISGKILANSGLDRANLKGLKEADTVEKLGAWVAMKNVDASIVWDATAASYADAAEVIEIPKDANVISHVVVGLMTTSRDKAAARRFIAFMAGEKGKSILAANGYRTEAP